MKSQERTKAVQYIQVATRNEWEGGAQVERHRDTIGLYCDKNALSIACSFVDIGRVCRPLQREGLRSALAALRGGKASVLVVPSVTHLSRSIAELLAIIAENFGPSQPIGALVSVADGIDTRTPQGRMALDVMRCLADLSPSTRRAHA